MRNLRKSDTLILANTKMEAPPDMNLLDLLLSPENKGAMDSLSQNFNLSPQQTNAAVKELIPALTRGMQKNTGDAPGLDDLLAALQKGNHSNYLDSPDVLGKSATANDGNDILGHIFGNKQVSRDVAARASQRSGIASGVLKKMLPIVATMVMGQLGKKLLGGGQPVNRSSSGGLVSSLLDSDRDGSIWDDLLGMGARAMLR